MHMIIWCYNVFTKTLCKTRECLFSLEVMLICMNFYSLICIWKLMQLQKSSHHPISMLNKLYSLHLFWWFGHSCRSTVFPNFTYLDAMIHFILHGRNIFYNSRLHYLEMVVSCLRCQILKALMQIRSDHSW